MALLTVANQWYTAFLFLPNLVAQALMPLLARARHDNRELLLKAIKGILMCLPLMLFGGVLSPWLMNLYGRGFTAGWPGR